MSFFNEKLARICESHKQIKNILESFQCRQQLLYNNIYLILTSICQLKSKDSKISLSLG